MSDHTNRKARVVEGPIPRKSSDFAGLYRRVPSRTLLPEIRLIGLLNVTDVEKQAPLP